MYGLTLDAASPLGRFGAAVVPGGPERAYAATRSFTTTVAALYALAGRLGVQVDVRGLSESVGPALGPLPELEAACATLEGADAIFVTGRGPLHGLAEYVALLLMELARVPCAALEAAQFRHGPQEAAGRGLGVLALAAQGETGDLVRRFAAELAEAGSPTVLLDAGGAPARRRGARDACAARGGRARGRAADGGGAQRLAVGLAEARGVRRACRCAREGDAGGVSGGA